MFGERPDLDLCADLYARDELLVDERVDDQLRLHWPKTGYGRPAEESAGVCVKLSRGAARR